MYSVSIGKGQAMNTVDLLLGLGSQLASITKDLLERRNLSRQEKQDVLAIVEQYESVQRDYADIKDTLRYYYRAIDTAIATFNGFDGLQQVYSKDYRSRITSIIKNLVQSNYRSRMVQSFEILSINISTIQSTSEGKQVNDTIADVLDREKWLLTKNDTSSEVGDF
jgi:hypothetical protein